MRFYLFLVKTHHDEFSDNHWYLVRAKTIKQAEIKLHKEDNGEILEMKVLPIRMYIK